MSCCPDKPSFVLEGEPASTVVLLAHGAGANMDSEFMQAMSVGLVAKGCQVMRFNFPYMQANAIDGNSDMRNQWTVHACSRGWTCQTALMG